MAISYHDVIVIGAGPAGLCAGLYTARARLDTVILEKMAPGGQLINTSLIEDYPGFESHRRRRSHREDGFPHPGVRRTDTHC